MSSHQSPSSSSPSPLDCRPIFHQIRSDPVPTSGGIGSSASSPPVTLTTQEVLNDLRGFIMDGDWESVIYFYGQYKNIVQTAKIKSFMNQTVLHLAISDTRDDVVNDVVKKLLDIVDAHVIRDMIDHRNENPLHLAASLDQTDTCNLLVNKDPELIGAQNIDGETPLFIAARNGKKRAFYALHPKCPITGQDIKHDIRHCKRNDGDTILHVSILGEYFELAFQILCWYPELMESHNQKGQTALHLLAQNPSAFKSWCDMGFVEDFIYRCLIVDFAKFEKPSDFKEEHGSKVTSPIRGNCKICLDSLITAWKKVINAIGLIVDFAKFEKPSDFKEERGLKVTSQIRGNCKICLDSLITAWKKVINAIVNTAWEWKGIAGNKDVEKQQFPGQSTSNDRRQAMEDPNPDNKVEEQSIDCDHDHINGFDLIGRMWNSGVYLPLPFDQSDSWAFHRRILQFTIELLLSVLGLGFIQVTSIKKKKKTHTLAAQIAKMLVCYASESDSGSSPKNDHSSEGTLQQKELVTDKNDHSSEGTHQQKELVTDKNDHSSKDMKDQSTPFLIAAKMGVLEIVQGIMEHHPMAIHQEDVHKKNAVLLAVEHKHPRTYNLLQKKYFSYQSIFQKLDENGNSAFHLAARGTTDHTWRIRGAALQIQWDLKWYNHIESKMPRACKSLARQKNDEGKTAMEVFHEGHKEMAKEGVQWLINTSQSCSVVAALIASVAYASTTTVPGGLKEGTAIPLLRGQPAFNIFITSSLLALCLSVTSLTMFLSILTSRYQTSDFLRNLPTKLILGLSSLFVSIAAMLVSFSAGHFFDLEEQLRRTAFPIYAVICLPVSLYAMTQFRLYIDLIKSFIRTVPQRSHDKLTI